MSAIHDPSPAPVAAPERISSKPAPPSPSSPWRWKAWLMAAAVLLAAAMVYPWVRSQPERQSAQASLRTTRVVMGPLDRLLRVSGSTAARNFAAIVAPMMRGPDSGRNMVLIRLVKAGSMVKRGDLIVQIDAQTLKDHVDDVNSLVRQAETDIKKRKAEQAIETERLRQTVRVAAASLDKAKLDQSATEIRTSIDKELLQLAVEEAEAQYKQVQADIATTQEKHRAEIRILEYTQERHVRHRDRHQHDVDKFTMLAPIGGLVVMQSTWRGGEFGQIQEGDQVYPGQPFMKIVDTGSMQLEATVNQVESEGIRIGQPAVIRFDAFQGLQLNGKVQAVGAMGKGGWRENYYVRNIPVKIAIQGSDSRVIPDLSASADVLLERKENMLLAPFEAVSLEGAKARVFVRQGDGFTVREVELGERNNTHVAVLAGLEAGDEVALGRPSSAQP